MEALSTCFRRRRAESGVESFGESISLVILLRLGVGHSLGTAYTVTVNSLVESNKQTNDCG